jgi:hypothetical protein
LVRSVLAGAQAADPDDGSKEAIEAELDSPPEDSKRAAKAPREPAVVPFSFEERPFALAAVVGLATFVGEFGFVADVTPSRWVSFGAGAGTNLEGPQYAAYLRARPLHWTGGRALAVATTFSLSTGPYQEFYWSSAGEYGVVDTRGADRALWGQFDLSFELRARSGFMLLAGFGLAHRLAASGEYCLITGRKVPGTCDSPYGGQSLTLRTLTIAVGHSFGVSR